jgi:hypothetical protein
MRLESDSVQIFGRDRTDKNGTGEETKQFELEECLVPCGTDSLSASCHAVQTV